MGCPRLGYPWVGLVWAGLGWAGLQSWQNGWAGLGWVGKIQAYIDFGLLKFGLVNVLRRQ